MSGVRVEVVRPCKCRVSHHPFCDGDIRTSFTEWPPEAIEAAAETLCDAEDAADSGIAFPCPQCSETAELALAAVWGVLVGEDT